MGKGPSTNATLLYQKMTDPATDPSVIAKIEKELGLNPGSFTGKVRDPALLKSLENTAYKGKGTGIGDPVRMGIGSAVGEAIERKSAQPMVDIIKRAPKGKIAAILALLGIGHGTSSALGFGDRAATASQEAAEIEKFRKMLQQQISEQAAKGGK